MTNVDRIRVIVRDDMAANQPCIVDLDTNTVELNATLDRARQLKALRWALDRFEFYCDDIDDRPKPEVPVKPLVPATVFEPALGLYFGAGATS